MGDVVNLNRFRKQKAKDGKDATAAGNRSKFGRTKAAREREELMRKIDESKLDQHKLPPDPDNNPQR